MEKFELQEHCAQCPFRQHYESFMDARRQYYEANKDRLLARQREYREANKERIAARQREYNEANKERIAARKREYNEANKERIAARKKEQYRKKHPVARVCMSDKLRSEFGESLHDVDVGAFRAFALSSARRGAKYDFDRNDAIFRLALSDGITIAAKQYGTTTERARQIMNKHAILLRRFIREGVEGTEQ